MGFSRQEHWSGLPFPSPGDHLNPGIESVSPALGGGLFTTELPGKPLSHILLPSKNTAVLKSREDRAKRSMGSRKGRRSQKGKSVWDERSVWKLGV